MKTMSSGLLAFAALALVASPSFAQGFRKTKIASGLDHPNGIALSPAGQVYFTELPEPGKMGGRNTVARLDKNGKKLVIVRGEPGPTNLAFDRRGNYYWTCRFAGVLMQGNGRSHRAIAKGLKSPNGVAVDAKGQVFFSQIPNPGKKGMGNNIAMLVNGKAKVLKMGEPEPFDLAVAANGSIYWTCRTAGVILKRDRQGKVTKILSGLEKPSGLAMDASGKLYFSETPTPGKPGSKGGRNKVWEYDPRSKNFALISFGEPLPIDVAVSRDGRKVYWTCNTAGVIFRADRMPGAQAHLASRQEPKLGTRFVIQLRAPRSPRKAYRVATSLGRGPIHFDRRYVALAPDGIFFASFFDRLSPIFMNYGGKLDAMGNGQASIKIPAVPGLKGLALQTAFLVLDAKAPSGIAELSTSLRSVLD